MAHEDSGVFYHVQPYEKCYLQSDRFVLSNGSGYTSIAIHMTLGSKVKEIGSQTQWVWLPISMYL